MRSALLFLLLLLTACASHVTSIKNDNIAPLAAGLGYVLLGIETNRSLDFVIIDGPKKIKLGKEDLREGTNYLLVDLPAGTYTVEEVRLTLYAQFELDQPERWQFSIEPQKISYVGHLEFASSGFWRYVRARLELVNRSSEALVFMESNFPEILSGFALIYKGPGEDSFLEEMTKGFKTP